MRYKDKEWTKSELIHELEDKDSRLTDAQALCDYRGQINAQYQKEMADLRHDLQQNKMAKDYAESVTASLQQKCDGLEKERSQWSDVTGKETLARTKAEAQFRRAINALGLLHETLDAVLTMVEHND